MVQISKKLLNHCPEQYPFRAQGSDLEPFLEISAKVKNFLKGQIKPKADFRAVNSPKKRTNEFVYTIMTNLLVHFFGRKSPFEII